MITVNDLTHLKRLASERRAVYCPRHATWAKWPKPAAFMINLSGVRLEQLFRLGLYVYDPTAQRDDAAALRDYDYGETAQETNDEQANEQCANKYWAERGYLRNWPPEVVNCRCGQETNDETG